MVPPPLVSISETAGGHEGRWECQPLPTMPNKTQPSMGGICYLGNFLGDCHVRRVPRLRGLSRRESGGTTRVRRRGAVYLGPSLHNCRAEIRRYSSTDTSNPWSTWSTWSAVINRTSRAGELRSAPSGPDDWHRVAGKRALAQGVRVRRAITRVSEG